MIYQRFYAEQFDVQGVLQGAKLHHPANFNFAYDVIDVLAKEQPQKPAMLWRNERGEEARFSFGEIARLSKQAANVLLSLGLHKGEVFMVCLKTHHEYWYWALGAHRLGVILCPVFHLLSVEDFIYRMEASGAKLFLCTHEGETPARVREAAAQVGLSALYSIQETRAGFQNMTPLLENAPSYCPRYETNAHEPILLYFTSGTTGKPKGVLHDHTYPLSSALAARYMQDVSAESLHFATGNTAWSVIGGTKFYGPWLCEACIFVYDYERFDPVAVLEQLEAVRVTSMMAQPTVYRALLAVGMDKYDLSQLLSFSVGGEKLTEDIAQGVWEQMGQILYEGYAQSEAGLIAASSKNAGRRDGSVGKILPKYHVEILQDDGSFAPPFGVGEIVLIADGGKRPIGLLMGYWHDSAATEALWDGNIFHTGDQGYRDGDNFLYFLGRADGLIKTRGYRVSPFEIENELSQHQAVYECLVLGVPDVRYGNHLEGFVRLQAGIPPSKALQKEILSWYNARCSGHKKLSHLHFVQDFPRNDNGKLMRKQFATNAQQFTIYNS